MTFIELGELCDKGTSNLAQKDLLIDSGRYPVYGAAGEITKVDFYQQSKPYLGIVKDGAGVGRVMRLPSNSSVIGTLQYIFPKENVDIKYLYYLIKYLDLGKSNTGATIPHIYFKDYKKRKVRAKSYNEQKYIGKIFELIEGNLITYNRILECYDLFIKSRFVEIFGDPNASRTKYKLVPIHMVTDCMVPGRDKPKSFTGEIPWITINDLIINGYTNKSKIGLGLTIDEVKEVNRKCVPQGSVLMSCVGNLGLCSIASVDVVINQQLHSYQCNELINNLYLMYYLSFKNTYMNKVASSTTVLYMNKHVCNNIPVLLPPIELQISFAKYLNQINKLKSDVQKSIDETQLLMDSLMQEYFG